jgi:predicted metal-dependent hydrolase
MPNSQDAAALPAEYLDGIRLFNAREFFDCHDVLEELWTDFIGPEREFYKGLIQAAVALHHFSEGNAHGARKLYRSSSSYLAPYQPQTRGLDVTRFLEQFERCFRDLLAAPVNAPCLELNAALVPSIELSTERPNHE